MLTRTELVFMWELYVRKSLTRKEQNVCRTQHFYKMIQNLRRNGLVESQEVRGENRYFLTSPRGVVRAIIEGKDFNTPARYRKFFKDEEVLVG